MNDNFKLLYETYIKHLQSFKDFEIMDGTAFAAYASDVLSGMDVIETVYKGRKGLLYYSLEDEGEKRCCRVPVCGYYAEDEKMMVRLFQMLAEKAVTDKPCDFSVDLYAADSVCVQAFHMMQFGNIAEKGISKLDESIEISTSCHNIRPLDKTQINEHWTEIWNMIHRIVTHLQNSPVFYPGEEFTEDVYRGFFMDESVELIAAFDGGKIIGIIEWNTDGNQMLGGGSRAVNVGEAFVEPALRGSGLADALLKTAQKRAKEAGNSFMWVEHGTANPNARGFWNKHFRTYQYELVRTVKPL